jgi:hypothetical protein
MRGSAAQCPQGTTRRQKLLIEVESEALLWAATTQQAAA